jgi:hypothetical protein
MTDIPLLHLPLRWVTFLCLLVVDALASSVALREIWHWFAYDAGPAPSPGRMFAVCVAARILFRPPSGLGIEQSGKQQLLHSALLWASIGTFLLLSWCAGAVFGWVLPL